ncbi:putative DNA helicase [Lupinus albus]|uniref:DNA 3'-5' helicase n=1 Tax=Lupinus albus TaxID=3870 RepID=A0A6A4PP89_LUPAL|nr:putative DNA helicase [Lupinus albus]
MQSDSDSDGSHVSTTPPRQQPPSPSLPISKKSRIRTKPSKPKPLLTRPDKPDPIPEPIHQIQDPFCVPSSLPFRIRRSSDCVPSQSTSHSIETLPAGFFAKSVSFSKIRRTFVDFEDSGKEPVLNYVSDAAVSGVDMRRGEEEGLAARNPVKLLKRHPNLIGANAPMPAAKLRKCGGEGNFVRLNLNGKKRKFVNKGWKKNGKFRGSKRYWKSKVKLEHEGEGDQVQPEFEEEGLVVENAKDKQRGSCKTKEVSCNQLEEMVSSARVDPSDENLVKLLKLIYGYESFRDGQLEAIKMVLAGKSTMLILPTGAGKSLCYQLPALILPGITLVVSPLVALMIDQLRQLPPVIKGGLLSSNQTPEEASKTLNLLRQGAIKVLFVSPERFLNEEFLSIISVLSTITLVIDEAHCISEWSHNFRPSFMRLRASLLHKKLNVGSILAMTATATTKTLDSIMSALDIPCTNLIQRAQLRDNLRLSVSLVRNRMKDLLIMIKSSPFSEVSSIIIYCKFQYETDQISRYLNDNNILAKSYHSGITAKERNYVQELFSSNKIRVVVATVAFGMGVDKRDVGAVIHYSLPESLEEYVQEIGRAGRDGRLSHCHLLYDDETYFKLRSLMHSEGVDEYAVNKFLREVFPVDKNSHGKIFSLVKESASRRFDMKEEVMLTLLTRLELGDVQYLHLLPQTNATCALNFHKTTPLLLAQKVSAVSAILKRSENKQGLYVFDIPTVANDMGVTAVELTNQLYDLKLKGEVTYEMKDMAYCYRIVEVPIDLLSLSVSITQWLSEVESCKVRKVDAMFNAVYFALNLCDKMNGCNGADHTPCLQMKTLDYFAGLDIHDFCKKIGQSSPFLRADIKVFLQSNSQARFTPRALARIMHGIASPAYPSTIWSKTHFWGRYKHIDFQVIMEAAKAELKNFVGKDVL